MLFRFFFLFLLFTACSSAEPTHFSSSVAKIEGNTIYFSDGQKATLPFVKDQAATTIYLVRHAEKAKEGGKDPLLTTAGKERAMRLKSILEKANITQILSTNYQRTQLTAQPSADFFELPIQPYNPSDLAGFAQQIKTEKQGQQLLVTGHSNTTPTLVNALVGKEEFPMIEESDYTHLFVVRISKKGEVKVLDLKY